MRAHLFLARHDRVVHVRLELVGHAAADARHHREQVERVLAAGVALEHVAQRLDEPRAAHRVAPRVVACQCRVRVECRLVQNKHSGPYDAVDARAAAAPASRQAKLQQPLTLTLTGHHRVGHEEVGLRGDAAHDAAVALVAAAPARAVVCHLYASVELRAATCL